MGNTKDTGFLRNLISYDASGNIVLPANLTVTGSLLTSSGALYATQSYVTTQISNLVNAAPGALDTLNELAAALGNDANFSTTVTNSIATKVSGTGTTSYIPKFSASGTIANSFISQDSFGAIVDTGSSSSNFTVISTDTAALNIRGGNNYGYFQSDYYGFLLHTQNGVTGNDLFYYDWVAKSLELGANGATRIKITSTGNVGIGVTSPAVKLDVSGSIRAGGAFTLGSGYAINFYDAGTTAYTWIEGSSYNQAYSFLAFTTGGSEKVRIISDGKMGIGTNAPNKALEILSISDQLRLSYNASTYTDLRSDSAGGLLIKAGGGYIIQYINGSEKTRLTSAGALGIGTNSPSTLLHVVSNDGSANRTDPFNVATITATSGSSPYNGFGTGLVFAATHYDGIVYNGARIRSILNDNSVSSLGNSLAFDITSTRGGSFTEAVRIAYNGSVGIGATSITNHKLQITGSIANVFLQSSADGSAIDYGSYGISSSYPQVRLTMVDDGNWGGHFFISTKPGGASTNALVERVRVTSGGNVGVGVTSPSWKLSVANEMVVGAQGGSDFTYISGGSGYGSVIRNYYATGTINNEFRGNGNNYVNLGYGSFGIGTSNPLAKLHVSGGKIIHTSDDGGYGQFQINASTTSTEATILLSNGGSGVNNGNYTNVGVIGMGAYGNARDTLVIGTGYNAGSMFMKNGTTTFSGNVVNSASYKANTFVQLTTIATKTFSVSGQTSGSFAVTDFSGVPSNAKAVAVYGWYHITGYGSGAGQGDHAVSWFGLANDNSVISWSGPGGPWPGSGAFTNQYYGSFSMEHDGDASGANMTNFMHYYGSWHNGIINVNANGSIYYTLGFGYSGGTHHNALYCTGYWI